MRRTRDKDLTVEELRKQADIECDLDPMQLDIEWVGQAKLFRKYSDLLADANKKQAEADEAIKTTRSKLTLKCIEDPEHTLGVEKPTDKRIEAYYRTRKVYIKRKEKWIEATHIVDTLKGIVFSLHQRKAALEYLVELFTAAYFAGPKEPRDLSTEGMRKLTRKMARAKVKQAMESE